MRTLQVPIKIVLELIAIADYSGYDHQSILMDAFADMLDNQLSDEEIETHCQWFLSPEAKEKGYGPEDYDNVMETLTNYRDEYITSDEEE